MLRRDVFQAIADPTRRAILQLVATQSLNLNTVADRFPISRPAISRHMKILTECGLVTITREGRERFCEGRMEKLNEVYDWVEPYRQFWSRQLDALEQHLAKDAKKKKKQGNKKKKKKH